MYIGIIQRVLLYAEHVLQLTVCRKHDFLYIEHDSSLYLVVLVFFFFYQTPPEFYSTHLAIHSLIKHKSILSSYCCTTSDCILLPYDKVLITYIFFRLKFLLSKGIWVIWARITLLNNFHHIFLHDKHDILCNYGVFNSITSKIKEYVLLPLLY